MGRPNLEFPQCFFEGEELEGFYVESMMKKAWAAELEVFFEIDRICKKHNITYFADSGTLLGAVRHKGFIPWDDDIDLVMLRKDYNRFISVVREELPKGLVVFYAFFDTYKYDPHLCLFNSDVYSTKSDYLERFHGCPYPVGVDIFPLDHVPEDRELVMIHKNLISLLVRLIRQDFNNTTVEQQLAQVEELLGVHIDRTGDVRRQLAQLMEKIVQIYTAEEGDSVTVWGLYAEGHYVELPRELFEERIELPFENMSVPTVKNYDMMLRKLYGEDYMTPKIGTASHEYPFYNMIRRELEKRAKEMGIENFECMK